MIISIALGIVLAVVILRLLPVMAGLAAIALAVAYRAVLGLMRLLKGQLRAARRSRSVRFGLFLSAIIVAFHALIR